MRCRASSPFRSSGPARSVALAARTSSALTGLQRASARLVPAARQDWPEAVLAEAGEVLAGPRRVAWLGRGLLLVARAR